MNDESSHLLFPNTSTDPNTYYISMTLGTNYRAKTGNNVSEFMHSNWITQSYYSNPKGKSPLHRYLIHFFDFSPLNLDHTTSFVKFQLRSDMPSCALSCHVC